MKDLSGRGTVPKSGEFLTKDQGDFNVGLDVKAAELCVDLRMPLENGKAAHLNPKDYKGNKVVLNLSLDTTRATWKRLGPFFTKEREKQTARLA